MIDSATCITILEKGLWRHKLYNWLPLLVQTFEKDIDGVIYKKSNIIIKAMINRTNEGEN